MTEDMSKNIKIYHTSTAYEKIPEIIWFQIFKYFDLKEFMKCKLLSKKILNFTDNYSVIFENECLRIFTSPLYFFRYFL